MIRLNDVCFAYDGVPALRHIDLQVSPGETVVLQGGNGCGKTTLLKLLNGLIFPEVGTYHFRGKPITEKAMRNNAFAKAFHRQVGYVFQNPDTQLFCPTVEEEIAFGPRQMGLPKEEVARRIDDMLILLGLAHLRGRPPYHLSGGEKRKVSLACVLSMDPEVLVLDEPIAGLDEKTQAWLTEFLLALKRGCKTLVIATHNTQLAGALADRVFRMEEGREVYQ